MQQPPGVEQFFAVARERYRIMLAKQADLPWPWTDDPILRQYRFTCVHREDDRTTRWFAANVRDPLSGDGARVLMATVAFRWFNRVETGERLLPVLLSGEWDEPTAVRLLLQEPVVHPVVTGGYIVLGVRGMPKPEGVCRAIAMFSERAAQLKLHTGLSHCDTLRAAHELLRSEYQYMGAFMAYEVVSDLRWTSLLCGASDILTWCYLGPGATRGLGRLLHDDVDHYSQARDQDEMLEECRGLLAMARGDSAVWPAEWRPWEMREVEHWLCEYDKYVRASRGEGRMKRTYKPPTHREGLEP